MLSFLVCLILGLAYCCRSTFASQLPPTEMDALHDFYDATSGADWECSQSGNPWNFSDGENPCESDWVGLTCALSNGGDVYRVSEIYFEECNLDGTIPETIRAFRNLTDLVLSKNGRLYGTIPNSIGELKNLKYLILTDNSLSGSIPASISTLSNLFELYLYNNKLDGMIEQLFNTSVQQDLTYVDISQNAFTGSIPSSMFKNSTVQSLSLGSNCFHGTLPRSICDASKLDVLEFSCLACGSSCIQHIFHKSNFIVQNPVHGTIPECLFTLPKLSSLMMRQNYFTGPLPKPLPRLPINAVINLENNALTGTIPSALISGGVEGTNVVLELRNNRFSGSVPSDITIPLYSQIDLTYNHLSGKAFGGNWGSGISVNVLTGNILSCERDRSDLPEHDEAYDRYQCGSDNFNEPIFAWLCVFSALSLVALAVWHYHRKIDEYFGISRIRECLRSWYSLALGVHPELHIPGLVRIACIAKMLGRTGVYTAAAMVVLLAPIYAGLSEVYGTYQHQYAWVLAAVLLTGRVPFGICFVCFVCALIAVVVTLFWQHASQPASTIARDPLIGKRRFRVIAASAIYVVINFVVVSIVNVAFVASSVYASPEYQVGISVFKVGWNILCAPFLSRLLAYELSAARSDWFTLELFVSIMNNIGIPLLSVVCISPQCLYNLFGGVIYTFLADLTEVPSYDDPFYYSYQCGFVFMDYYSSAFVYMSLMTTFATPLIEVLAQRVQVWAGPGSCIHKIINIPLPRIMKDIETDPKNIPDRSILRPYFDATQFLVTQITYLALILTMGVVFPPLAVPIALTMAATTAFALLKVGRLVTNAADAKMLKYVEIVELECANIASPLEMKRAFWVVLWFGFFFYTIFLFDTLGEAVGFKRAYWVLILVPLLPLVAVGVYIAILFSPYATTVLGEEELQQEHQEQQEIDEDSSNLEFASSLSSSEPVNSPFVISTLSEGNGNNI